MPSMRTIKPAIKWISSGKQAAFYRFECIRINKVNPLLIGNPPLTQSLMIFPVAFNIHCTEFVLHLAITPAQIKGTPLPNGWFYRVLRPIKRSPSSLKVRQTKHASLLLTTHKTYNNI